MTGKFLALLCAAAPKGRVLEVGTSGGYSSLWLALACRERGDQLTTIVFWPYMALVDAFQHWIYENPSEASDRVTCEEKWGELWDRFMKGIDTSGFENYKKIYWHRQGHIHTIPFYYIEYGLAQLFAAAGAKFAFDAGTLKKAVELMEEVIEAMEARL